MDESGFWDLVDTSGSCWLWLGATRADGYGALRWKGKTERAHRVSWELAKGVSAGSACVLHSCDNPPCVNPAHLFSGDRLRNAQDREAKGRRGHVHGRRLTAEQVISIRQSPDKPVVLAKRFSVTVWNIYDILSRRTWKRTP